MPVDSPGGRGKLVGVVMGEATVSLDKGGFWSGPRGKIERIDETAAVEAPVVRDELEIETIAADEVGTLEEVLEVDMTTARPALLELPKRMSKAWLEKQDKEALQQVLDAGGLTQARRKRIEDFLRGD